MPLDGAYCLLDSSVLINFLKVDRVDLLGSHPLYRFLITPHVQGEVTEHYPDQLERLNKALASGILEGTRLDAPRELLEFVAMTKLKLGQGEAAAISAAVTRNHPLALEDLAAQKKARKAHASLIIITTRDIILDHVRAGSLTVQIADEIKGDLETKFRFRMPGFFSFSELLEKP